MAAAVVSGAMSLWSSLGGNPSSNNTAPSTSPIAFAAVILPALPSFSEAKSYMPAILAVSQAAVNQIPACAALFGTPSTRAGALNPATALSALYSRIGVFLPPANFIGGKPVSSAFVWSWLVGGNEAVTYDHLLYIGPSGVAIGPRVDINISSWNEQGENGAVSYNSMAESLLHEMGHVYGALVQQGSGGSQIVDDTNNPMASDDNRNLIYQTCFPAH